MAYTDALNEYAASRLCGVVGTFLHLAVLATVVLQLLWCIGSLYLFYVVAVFLIYLGSLLVAALGQLTLDLASGTLWERFLKITLFLPFTLLLAGLNAATSDFNVMALFASMISRPDDSSASLIVTRMSSSWTRCCTFGLLVGPCLVLAQILMSPFGIGSFGFLLLLFNFAHKLLELSCGQSATMARPMQTEIQIQGETPMAAILSSAFPLLSSLLFLYSRCPSWFVACIVHEQQNKEVVVVQHRVLASLGEDQKAKLIKSLVHSRLTSLTLGSGSAKSDRCQGNELFVCLLVKCLKDAPNFHTLRLERVQMNTACISLFSQLSRNCPLLSNLTCFKADLSDAVFCSCIPHLYHMKSLTALNLEGNNLKQQSAEMLANFLSTTKTLRVLNLANNQLGYVGGAHIANSLAVNISLEELNLNLNWLVGKDAQKNADVYKQIKAISVGKERSGFVASDGTKSIADALKVNTTLRILRLRENGMVNTSAQSFGSALEVNKTLQYLDLAKNVISGPGAESLAGALQNKVVFSLDYSGQRVDDRAKQDAIKVLKLRLPSSVVLLV